jgi:hypothetical protein
MTNVTNYVPAQHSRLSGTVANLFTAAVLVMAGVLAFSVFVNV